mmetsp:Transcript_31824/g.85000  ORF Transcript_31824/g.85000 Transcript_31824/m.85000 type:complete len:446 (-) Transcript_31824:44-1381(-)
MAKGDVLRTSRVLKKPGATATAVLKKPSATSSTVLKKPSATASTLGRRSAEVQRRRVLRKPSRPARAQRSLRRPSGQGAHRRGAAERSQEGQSSGDSEEEVVLDDAFFSQRAGFSFRAWSLELQSRQLLMSAARETYASHQNESFFISATATPSTLLEGFALEVFRFHVKQLGWAAGALSGDMPKAGAEYWVQHRGVSDDVALDTINWHFDKDEELLESCGIFAHPLIATATYLTNHGAPFVAVSAPIVQPGTDGSTLEPIGEEEVFFALPAVGRHVAFDGRLVHGCPSELTTSPGERISILVNIWLGHHPVGVGAPKNPGTILAMERAFDPLGPVRVAEVKASASRESDLSFAVGPWQIGGVARPHRGLLRDGLCRVRLEPGQITVGSLMELKLPRPRPKASSKAQTKVLKKPSLVNTVKRPSRDVRSPRLAQVKHALKRPSRR